MYTKIRVTEGDIMEFIKKGYRFSWVTGRRGVKSQVLKDLGWIGRGSKKTVENTVMGLIKSYNRTTRYLKLQEAAKRCVEIRHCPICQVIMYVGFNLKTKCYSCGKEVFINFDS